jgi:hypothetical protein
MLRVSSNSLMRVYLHHKTCATPQGNAERNLQLGKNPDELFSRTGYVIFRKES